jgi:sensor histidine kinase YesM
MPFLLQSSTLDIFHNPHENGITIFILGVLFVLSVYHSLLYFKNKDKSYLYYSLYTALIFVNYLNDTSFGFISTLTAPFIDILNYYDYPLIWLYNTVYFIFGLTFLNLKAYSKKWHSFLFKVIAILLIVIFSTTFLAGITGNKDYISTVNKYMIPFFFFFGIIVYYPLFKLKMPLKGYIIVGSLILFVSSLLAYYSHSLGFVAPESSLNFSIFFIGVLIENVVFSLGLGQKQKHILKEKNDSQEKLIDQFQENEKLRNIVQQQLKKEVILLNQQAEIDKHEKTKAKFDKEFAELKIASLRSQMNPHFIFNSLNAIKLYIIDNKKENAVYYLNKFSKLIRKILASTREKEITLVEEIETIKLYIDIENIRFNNEIESLFTIDKKMNLETIKIPSLILQPFVENAIWHGLSLKKENKKLHITISKKEDTHIKITIEDNGVGREKSALIKQKKLYKKESIGINLTKERLSVFEKDYENSYSIKFKDLYDENKKAIGTKVILKIPVK